MKVAVTVDELRAAADKLAAAVEEYGSATAATKAAADTVSASWEGVGRNEFVEEQEEAVQCYQKVADAANVYIAAVRAAAAMYETLNDMAPSIVNG